MLSEDELVRLEKISSINKQKEYINTRGFVKFLLINNFSISSLPHMISILNRSSGQPFIQAFKGDVIKELDFNISLSHSADKIAVVIDSCDNFGIDIQKIMSFDQSTKISRKIFHPNEMLNCPSEKEEFCRYITKLWSLKEAFVKATTDTSVSFKSLDFSDDKKIIFNENGYLFITEFIDLDYIVSFLIKADELKESCLETKIVHF